MRARDLAVPYPLLPADAPAAQAARLLAEEPVDAVFVERHGQLQGVVSDIGLLVRMLPGYIIEDPKLAQVVEEARLICCGGAWKATPPGSSCSGGVVRCPRSTATPP